MRYTEHDFTIDHIFDLIRILFSSIFIAPWRLFHNITLKLIFIDKDKLTRFAQVAVGINLSLIICECISLASVAKFNFMYTRLPALVLCFVLLALVYYLIGIYDQPMINYGKKPQVFEEKAPIVIDAINELKIPDEEPIESHQEESYVATYEDTTPLEDNLEDDGMDFSNMLSGSVDVDKLRETSAEYSKILEDAYKEDEFNMSAFAELNKDDFEMLDAMASDPLAQGDDLLNMLDDIDFDTIAG